MAGEITKPYVLKNTKMAVVDEVAEGTAIAEDAAGALYFVADGLEFNLDAEMLESDEITNSLTETAPQKGMDSEDLGFSVSMNIRGKGTKTSPGFAIFLKSIMGLQNANTDNAVKAAPAPTTDIVTANAANDFDEGQLLLINDDIVRLTDIATEVLSLFPPLTATPVALDDIFAGISWMLASSDHPTFTSYIYFKNTLRLRYAGCRAVNCEMSFEVGQYTKMAFTVKALSALYDRTASVITSTYDDTTKPLVCKGISSKTVLSAVAKGAPTQVQTILTAPNFQVVVGDYIVLDIGAGIYETRLISGVTGTEGADQTLAHASATAAATATETVYIVHTACAYIGETLTLTIEMEDVAEKCMIAESGFSGRSFTGRKVNISRSPFFRNWQEFLIRDNIIGSLLQITLGDDANNIFTVLIPNQVTGEVSLTTDELMKVDVTSQAVKGATLGNDHELVIATF